MFVIKVYLKIIYRFNILYEKGFGENAVLSIFFIIRFISFGLKSKIFFNLKFILVILIFGF